MSNFSIFESFSLLEKCLGVSSSAGCGGNGSGGTAGQLFDRFGSNFNRKTESDSGNARKTYRKDSVAVSDS